jgi:hypothetical protein
MLLLRRMLVGYDRYLATPTARHGTSSTRSGPQGSRHHHGHHLSSPQQSGAIAAHQQHQHPHVVHADNSHDGIMDLAHHSDSSN